MTNANLLLQYLVGMIVIGAVINMPAWSQLVYTRFTDPTRSVPWWNDAYIWTRLGMVLHGPAVAAAYGYWGIDHFINGNVPMHPVGFYLATRSLIAIAEACFIRGAYLFGSQRAAWAWISLTITWSGVCIFWGII